MALLDLSELEYRLNQIDHALAHITLTLTGLETRMATLEEVTVALTDAVDRIGVVLTDVTAVATNAQTAAQAAQDALDAANAADLVEDADFQAQIDALKVALADAQAALAAQAAANTNAAAVISTQVAELNALG
jgi:chromosome segregation ATPase